MKRKRIVAKRVRRDPFTRAHETAQARLSRALAELERHETKAEELRVEIPRLQRIIRAFAGETQAVTQPALRRGNVRISGVEPAIDIPAHLERFLHPLETPAIDPANADEDDFLPEPRGQEILP